MSAKQINREHLVIKLTFLFRLQATIGAANRDRLKAGGLIGILSSVVRSGLEVAYRGKDSNEYLFNEPNLTKNLNHWCEIVEQHFNDLIQEIVSIKENAKSPQTALGSETVAILARMEMIADDIIGTKLQVSRGQDDGPDTKGSDLQSSNAGETSTQEQQAQIPKD